LELGKLRLWNEREENGRGIPRYKDLRKQGTRASGGTRDDYPMIKDLYINAELSQ